LVGTGGVPDEFAEGEGNFTFAGFGGEGLGVEDWEGTRYRMKKEDFLQYWNLTGVYWSLG